MGYENRDYARGDSDRGGWGPIGHSGGGFRDWPVWKKILAINVAVFLLQIFFVRPATMEDFPKSERFKDMDVSAAQILQGRQVSVVQKWLELDSRKVLQGQVWRVVTCGFCHNRMGIWHIVMNMLFLFWFGSRLEARYGSKEFAVFYFCSLLSASFAYIALDLYTGTMIPAIGASGAVWGITALYALLYPHDTIRIYFLFPVPIWLMALVYFLFDLHPVLLALSGQTIFSGVGHAAHVGGAVFGWLYYRNDWQLVSFLGRLIGRKPTFANSRSSQNRQRIIPMNGPYAEKQEQTTDRVDQILEKISAEGRESLTEEEEQFMLDQSTKMRQRR